MQRHGAGGGLPPATAGNCARVCASVTARESRCVQRARSRPRTAHTISHTCAVQHLAACLRCVSAGAADVVSAQARCALLIQLVAAGP